MFKFELESDPLSDVQSDLTRTICYAAISNNLVTLRMLDSRISRRLKYLDWPIILIFKWDASGIIFYLGLHDRSTYVPSE